MKSKKQDTRSEDRVKDAYEKLRGENRQLRKKLSQLQKRNKKLIESEPLDWVDSEEPLENLKESEQEHKDKCPKCKEVLKLVKAGIFEIRLCESCGWKRRKKVDSPD